MFCTIMYLYFINFSAYCSKRNMTFFIARVNASSTAHKPNKNCIRLEVLFRLTPLFLHYLLVTLLVTLLVVRNNN